jgi:hypothetical protein
LRSKRASGCAGSNARKLFLRDLRECCAAAHHRWHRRTRPPMCFSTSALVRMSNRRVSMFQCCHRFRSDAVNPTEISRSDNDAIIHRGTIGSLPLTLPRQRVPHSKSATQKLVIFVVTPAILTRRHKPWRRGASKRPGGWANGSLHQRRYSRNVGR